MKKESKSIVNTDIYDKEIKKMQEQINYLNGMLFKMNNNPVFEKNVFKRIGKQIVFSWAKRNINIYSQVTLKKLKKTASIYEDSFEKVDKIKCITYRPSAPRGGRGGGGAVLSAMQEIIGNSINNIPVEYKYSEKDGIWHTLKNKYFNEWTYPNFINEESNLIMLWAAIAFVIEETRNDSNTLYVCHDYSTGFALSMLKKKYILVIHTQGPRLEEKTNLGEPITKEEGKIISYCENIAMMNAQKVCFPSEGGKEYFFNSKYCNVKRENVSLGDTLYNTVYADIKEERLNNVEENKNVCTFLSVGTMTYAKGQDKVCEFLETLLKMDSKNEYRWICVGRGPFAEEVNRKANELKSMYVNFDYIYYEKCTFREVKYLQMISDYYVMLHRISIFDLATLEAMQNANGLILTKTGGNLEYNCEENVIYLENGDYMGLVEKVISADKNYQKELNQKCYQKYFSKQQFKERYIKQLNSILDEIEACR